LSKATHFDQLHPIYQGFAVIDERGPRRARPAALSTLLMKIA
jgi:hypothetical protein